MTVPEAPIGDIEPAPQVPTQQASEQQQQQQQQQALTQQNQEPGFKSSSATSDDNKKSQSDSDLQVLPPPPSAPVPTQSPSLSTPTLIPNAIAESKTQPTQQPINNDGSQPATRPFAPTLHSPHMQVNPYMHLNHPVPFPHHSNASAAYMYGRPGVLNGPAVLNGPQQPYPLHPLIVRQAISPHIQPQQIQPMAMYARNGVPPQQGPTSVGGRADTNNSLVATNASAAAAPQALATPPQPPKQALMQQPVKLSAGDIQTDGRAVKGVKRKEDNTPQEEVAGALDQSLTIPSRVTVKINKKQKTDNDDKLATLSLPTSLSSTYAQSTEIALQSPDRMTASDKANVPANSLTGYSLPQYDMSAIDGLQSGVVACSNGDDSSVAERDATDRNGTHGTVVKSGEGAKSEGTGENLDEDTDEAGRMEDSLINNHANRDSFMAILSKVGLSREELQKVSTKKLNLLSTRRNLTQWEVLELKTDRRRAKNRAAAALCRMKKKQFLNDMEGNMSQLKGDNRRLMSEFSRLTQEYRELCRHTRNRKEHNGKLFSRVCELRSKLKSFCEGQSPDVSMCIGFSLDAPSDSAAGSTAGSTDTPANTDAKPDTLPQPPASANDSIQMSGMCLPSPGLSVALPNPDALALPSTETRTGNSETLTAGDSDGDSLRLPNPEFSMSSTSLTV
ncbi:hypothetical protein SARC_11006 [Sphaeroforma arctica JP610]|uniref:BZIP domain-containing protein n=1 Tax=Sphaeroforma arctica JP610 TaxID=667725 RepID=A0A0L0FIB4_9EUKA|nr:hypothetical protein SARC_11006 [Sphaeroforma arctica JP610]KNC76495.1 hypothetical protein SARC_11006 [Sphaeroforma arctica JP610]|eukprot:XP_014150397.1 hypothetical protein SARC_11006 [Sphaeroforma arctica JP610]